MAAVVLAVVLAGCDDDARHRSCPAPARPRSRSTPPSCARSRPRPAWRTARPDRRRGAARRSRCPASAAAPSVDLVLAAGAAGAQLLVRRLRAVQEGDAGAAGVPRAVRRPGAGPRRRLPGPVPRQRARGDQEARGHLPLAGRPGRRPPGLRRVREDPRHADDVLRRRRRAGSPTRGPAASTRPSEVADLVREHLGVDLPPRSSLAPPTSRRTPEPERPPGLAAAGRGGRPLDHRPRPDPVHAPGGRGAPRSARC